MIWPDASIITTLAGATVIVVGAIAGGAVQIIKAIRTVDEKTDTAIEQNVAIQAQNAEIKTRTDGHLTALREELAKQIARADALQTTLTTVLSMIEAMKTPTGIVVAAATEERRVRQADLERAKGSPADRRETP